MATLLKMQKPMARCRLGVVAAGAHLAEDVARCLSPCPSRGRRPSRPAPTARSAGSQDLGDSTVSGSRRTGSSPVRGPHALDPVDVGAAGGPARSRSSTSSRSGASSRFRALNRSWASTLSMARMRSGRSGWPGPVSCTTKQGWVSSKRRHRAPPLTASSAGRRPSRRAAARCRPARRSRARAASTIDPIVLEIASRRRPRAGTCRRSGSVPVKRLAGWRNTRCAASARISGVRLMRISLSPPSRLLTAAVAIVVRGHSALTAMPSRLELLRTCPSTHRLMPYLAIE